MVSKDELLRIINRYLLRRNEVPDNVIFVTDVCRCLRRSWYERKYMFRVNVYQLEGKLAHEELQSLCRDVLGGEPEVECRMKYRGIDIIGRCDCVLDDAVIEFKTSRAPLIRENYVKQAMMYAYMLGKKHAYVVVITNNSVVLEAYEVDNNVVYELVSRAVKLHEHLVKNEVPEPEKSELCRNCPFRNICHFDGGLTKYIPRHSK